MRPINQRWLMGTKGRIRYNSRFCTANCAPVAATSSGFDLMASQSRQVDPFGARDTFNTGRGQAGIFRLSKLQDLGLGDISRLPFSIRLLLESLLRNCDGYEVLEKDVKNLAAWNAAALAEVEIPFKPARVVLQDFTGVPCVVDLAAMRSAMQRLGGDPRRINPLI